MSNKKRAPTRSASSKGKQQAGGAASLILPILVGLLVVAFIVFAIVRVEKRQASAAAMTGTLQNTLSVPVVTAAPLPTTTAPYPNVVRISVKETKALMDTGEALLLDVRAKASYDQAHAVGALSFPEDTFDARVSELPKDKLLVLYCT
jgi:hypothetical protein